MTRRPGYKVLAETPWVLWLAGVVVFAVLRPAVAGDLPEVRERGVLRHLGVPYANFITGNGDGMDAELMKLFAAHLGVKYEYVQTDWDNVISDVSGQRIERKGDEVRVVGEAPVRGDVIANGLTILPWREKAISFSSPIFPTQVWLIARADSTLKPIQPSGDMQKDIAAVKTLLRGHDVLGKAKSCLEPSLYGLADTGANVRLFPGKLNELAPAIIKGDAELTILDVPDTLIALEKWPGQVKVIGPISPKQEMACGFAKTTPQLRQAFEEFLDKCRRDGTYDRLVRKYYPGIYRYYPEFFAKKPASIHTRPANGE
jgi:ABC-type amino acid transport substrate-binding protein